MRGTSSAPFSGREEYRIAPEIFGGHEYPFTALIEDQDVGEKFDLAPHINVGEWVVLVTFIIRIVDVNVESVRTDGLVGEVQLGGERVGLDNGLTVGTGHDVVDTVSLLCRKP